MTENIKTWLEAEEMPFKGWDFSLIRDEMEDIKVPWTYKEDILSVLKEDDRLLDMGTGGGEFLLTLNHPHKQTSVTEGYPPNLKMCQEELAPLGIEVKNVEEDLKLEFPDAYFDVVINRHESYDINEVNRVLKPEGTFITQQVGGKDLVDLSSYVCFDFKAEYYHLALDREVACFKEAGFDILVEDEKLGLSKFKSVEAFIYFARAIPWSFPDFTVKSHKAILEELQKEIENTGFFTGIEHRFYIVAKKR